MPQGINPLSSSLINKINFSGFSFFAVTPVIIPAGPAPIIITSYFFIFFFLFFEEVKIMRLFSLYKFFTINKDIFRDLMIAFH